MYSLNVSLRFYKIIKIVGECKVRISSVTLKEKLEKGM